ncbi:MAG: HDIG domain-containing protein [Deltaproteobacteria bacterium]|nr:HDIG domain-containing protein [Deltaproteobacteria bacterium]
MNIKPPRITFDKPAGNTALSIGIITLVAIISTLIFYPKFTIFRTPYNIGDISAENIKAPENFFIEDHDATIEKKQAARKDVLTVYDYDRSLENMLAQKIIQAFAIPRTIINSSGASGPNTQDDLHLKIIALKSEFEKIMGIPVSAGAYQVLENEKFSKKIPGLIIKILSGILGNGVVANKDLLLKENDKGISLKTIGVNDEKTVRNLRHFYGMDQARAMVRIIGDPLLKGMDYNLVNLIVDFTQRLVQPNITLNRRETEKRKSAAESGIKPILYQIKKGEMILREGQRVSRTDMLKLSALKKKTGRARLLEQGAGTALIILVLLIMTYYIHLRYRPEIRANQNKSLLFIASVLLSVFLMAQLSAALAGALSENTPLSIHSQSMFYGIPVAAGAMTICQFLGFSVAFPFAIVMAFITAILFENSYAYCLYFLLNSIMGAFWLQNSRHRKDLIQAGFRLGLLNIGLATIIDIYIADIGIIKILWDMTFAFAGGISAGIVTIGVTPIVEMAFGFTTDSTLLELSNLDQPLMRRLMLEAPGTYHHSVIVGSMAEAAASEIGANPLLAKVCGYYHDIGKLKNPLYFIENQKDGKNVHNKLAPSMSCLVLTSHVKNGVELAREYGLGQEITDAIKQHHGTSLIRFFYEKAKTVKKDQNVNIDDFRYPGPKPQTKETALIMMADVVEAAARTLEDPSPSRIQGMVQQLINKIFSDNQLDESPLTLKDLHSIARNFNKILNGIYHHRIEYPDKAFPENVKKKTRNGNTDTKSPEAQPDKDQADPADDENTLKRLGQT